ncbi:alpha-amylase family glycosyl hydrolase [Maribellus sediminis]|uniref:alpha-amylase family glycosyl hydrolase n=1 Tax=Maribellus sediminis TaxID=2696285 RepID=UPI001432266F|nr:alpha-amylase family glycosyl hydrolase [Maribellus sediminis]
MKQYYSILIVLAFVVGACSNSTQKTTAPVVDENPLAWSDDAVMYEVNVRQFTPEGTFNAFATHLPRLQELGVEILWFMPIHPIGKENRKGTLGSYYSIQDYKAVNPEFGTFEDFKSLVKQAHEMGYKVLIDCVANHTSWDNVWMSEHKDWYTLDSLGNVLPPNPDWSDVADLNYDNEEMRAAMIDAMEYWVAEADIDGYRCDYAGGVPTDFWEEARASLDEIKPVFMQAEDQDHLDLLNMAFDCNYGWTMHHYMNEIYSGEKSVDDIKTYFAQVDSTYPFGTYPLQFTSNHDENSWNGTAYERLGDAVKTFAVLSFTIPGMPLVYSGQEAGLDKRLEFFEKDEIDWNRDPSMTELYKQLIDLKQENPALWNGEAGGEIEFLETSAPEKLLAFTREKEGNSVLVVMNLSAEPLAGTVESEAGVYSSYFAGGEITLDANANFTLDPWDYKILIKN